MSTITRMETQRPPMDDSQLASEARKDIEAFAELYRRHVTRVYRYHMAHIGNIKDAEDLTSQTFMAALESIRSYRNTGTFGAWIMGIAVHKRALFFRGRRHVELPITSALELPDPNTSTDKAAIKRLELEQIRCALWHINADRAEVIALCFFGGLTCLEAGHALGKSEAAVRMLLSRGLRDLRSRTSLALEVQDE
jgi:RNA polymerase sigma-70 factor (ECF subfamily)